VVLTRLQQRGRAQQAADVIGTERRGGAQGHVCSSCSLDLGLRAIKSERLG
jgi:hypothetical protein